MTIQRESNDSAIAVWLMIHCLLIGSMCIIGSLALAWRRHRWRRVLARSRWRGFGYSCTDIPAGRGKQAVLVLTPVDAPTAEPVLIRVTGLRGRMNALRSHVLQTIWMAEDRNRIVVATPGPQALDAARHPRTDEQRAKWSAIARTAASASRA